MSDRILKIEKDNLLEMAVQKENGRMEIGTDLCCHDRSRL